MIHEVDEALRLLLADAGLPSEGTELVFDAPTTDWAAKRTVPTVNVFLYNILVEDTHRRAGGRTRSTTRPESRPAGGRHRAGTRSPTW